jgi:hypothetical protein
MQNLTDSNPHVSQRVFRRVAGHATPRVPLKSSSHPFTSEVMAGDKEKLEKAEATKAKCFQRLYELESNRAEHGDQDFQAPEQEYRVAALLVAQLANDAWQKIEENREAIREERLASRAALIERALALLEQVEELLPQIERDTRTASAMRDRNPAKLCATLPYRLNPPGSDALQRVKDALLGLGAKQMILVDGANLARLQNRASATDIRGVDITGTPPNLVTLTHTPGGLKNVGALRR